MIQTVIDAPVSDAVSPWVTFDLDGLAQLLAELEHRGYDVIGPKVENGVIELGPLASIDDLPAGWTDEQGPGHYRLIARPDDARFGFAVGPTSPKRTFHPPREPVWTMRRSSSGELEVEMHEPEPSRRALFGIRPCELAAIHRQDRVLDHVDRSYHTRRSDTFILVANCGNPAETCFCASMSTGPFAEPAGGADIVVTELVTTDDVRYLATAGTSLGNEVLSAVDSLPAVGSDLETAEDLRSRAEARLVRHLDRSRLRSGLLERLEDPHWADVGRRCLSCGNCTLVCPTCFCSTPEDTTDLTGNVARRDQVWDSCFSAAFSQLGDSPVRESIDARYRQWATHKLASWVDQFDELGCVGCGRCITWCPVGIDLTSEAQRLLAGDRS